MAGGQLSLVWCMAVTVVRSLLGTGKLPDAAARLPDQKHRPSNPPLRDGHGISRGVGLCNLNNTCYLNALLQCLAHCPQFATRCLGLPHSSNCTGNTILRRETDTRNGVFWSFLMPVTPACPAPCCMCAMKRLMVALLEAHDGQMIVPREIAKILSETFPGGQQHDPSEALTFIQDKLEQDSETHPGKAVTLMMAAVADLKEPEEAVAAVAAAAADLKDVVGAAVTNLKAAVKKVVAAATNFQTAAVAAAVEKKPATRSNFIQEVFGFRCGSQVACRECRYVGGQASEQYTQLSLGIEQVDSVAGALEMFTMAEAMIGDNQYKCSRCGTFRDADLQMRLTEGPNVLVVHLKRFAKTRNNNEEGAEGQSEWGPQDKSWDEQLGQKEGDTVITKIDKHLAFEPTLDLSPYMTTTERGGRQKGGCSTNGTDGGSTYTLRSVLVHRGNTQQSGHYISFVSDGEGKWWLKNDETTYLVTLEDVLRQQAYMLFYCRDGGPTTQPLWEPVSPSTEDDAVAALQQSATVSVFGRVQRQLQPEVGASEHRQMKNRWRLSRHGRSLSSIGDTDGGSGDFGATEVEKKGHEGGGKCSRGSEEPAVSPAPPAGPCTGGVSASSAPEWGPGGGSCVCTTLNSCGMGLGACAPQSCPFGAGGSTSFLAAPGPRNGASSSVSPPCSSALGCGASARGGAAAQEGRKRKRQAEGDWSTGSGGEPAEAEKGKQGVRGS
ncbi:hypothetical protein VaNZ11_002857 [Volvox africanus]|uniref:ubiquitinyl hydrolase 1 n=1 Tax=Volvox africanus TaxID=51714 RepID=A0ABQ5RSW2_9CHLO|nr:hypothetical protein VaNZ11_002857 [Volvox africanus]